MNLDRIFGGSGRVLRTLYQAPSMTFLVPVPLRKPRAKGKPTATTGFLGTSKRKPGKLNDMMKAKEQERAKRNTVI